MKKKKKMDVQTIVLVTFLSLFLVGIVTMLTIIVTTTTDDVESSQYYETFIKEKTKEKHLELLPFEIE